ncbi:tyrosine-type recombinase/integrase [Paenibacillus alvei]|uniref:Site-specific integrase n=1 Tax=Paenibacillus alvei TaxID=44250 RepID=A0AAP7A3G3_PAEAL|nr:site-specific integrase [Paenibacillus alvei]NOJ73122.1 site-specific integrase [Paenibacillus alvei]
MKLVLLSKYAIFWEAHCNLRAGTINAMKSTLKNFERFLIETFHFDSADEFDLDKLYYDEILGVYEPIDKTLIDEFVVYLRTNQASTSFKLYNSITYLKSFFGFLYRSTMIKQNPMANYRNNYYTREIKNRWLTPEECNSLLHYCRMNVLEEEYTMFLLLMTTGVRNSELRSLRYRHIDFEHSTIHIEEGQKTNIGTVFMPDILNLALKNYTSKKPFQQRLLSGNDYLFTLNCKNRLHVVALKKRIDELTLEAGIQRKVTPHTFRYTTAKLMQISGCNFSNIQRQLRHEHAYTTIRYLGCSEREIQLMEENTELFNPEIYMDENEE